MGRPKLGSCIHIVEDDKSNLGNGNSRLVEREDAVIFSQEEGSQVRDGWLGVVWRGSATAPAAARYIWTTVVGPQTRRTSTIHSSPCSCSFLYNLVLTRLLNTIGKPLSLNQFDYSTKLKTSSYTVGLAEISSTAQPQPSLGPSTAIQPHPSHLLSHLRRSDLYAGEAK